MEFLLIKESNTNRQIFLNPTHIVAISYNDIMKTIVIVTLQNTYQASFISFEPTEYIKYLSNMWINENNSMATKTNEIT